MNPVCDTPVVTVPTKTIKEIGKIYNENMFNTAPNISRMAYKNGLFSESIVVLTNSTTSTKKLAPYKEKMKIRLMTALQPLPLHFLLHRPSFLDPLVFWVWAFLFFHSLIMLGNDLSIMSE